MRKGKRSVPSSSGDITGTLKKNPIRLKSDDSELLEATSVSVGPWLSQYLWYEESRKPSREPLKNGGREREGIPIEQLPLLLSAQPRGEDRGVVVGDEGGAVEVRIEVDDVVPLLLSKQNVEVLELLANGNDAVPVGAVDVEHAIADVAGDVVEVLDGISDLEGVELIVERNLVGEGLAEDGVVHHSLLEVVLVHGVQLSIDQERDDLLVPSVLLLLLDIQLNEGVGRSDVVVEEVRVELQTTVVAELRHRDLAVAEVVVDASEGVGRAINEDGSQRGRIPPLEVELVEEGVGVWLQLGEGDVVDPVVVVQNVRNRLVSQIVCARKSSDQKDGCRDQNGNVRVVAAAGGSMLSSERWFRAARKLSRRNLSSRGWEVPHLSCRARLVLGVSQIIGQ